MASIALPLPDIKYEWLIELKYLKEGERSNLEQAKQKGLAQLQKYVASKNLTRKKSLDKTPQLRYSFPIKNKCIAHKRNLNHKIRTLVLDQKEFAKLKKQADSRKASKNCPRLRLRRVLP